MITQEQLGNKWRNIAAVKLDMPPIVPDDWAAFWYIWHAEKARAKRIGADRNNTGPGGWVGMDLLDPALAGNVRSFEQPYVPAMAEACPGMMRTIHENFPIKDIRVIRFWQSIVEIKPHREGWYPNSFRYPNEFRAMIYDENTRPTFYILPITDPANADSDVAKANAKLMHDRQYVDAKPGEAFVFNGETAYHGAEYDPGHSKILMIVKGPLDLDRYDDLMQRSVHKHGAIVMEVPAC